MVHYCRQYILPSRFSRRWYVWEPLPRLLSVLSNVQSPGSATNTTMVIVGMALLGFGGGNCQLAAFALPELLPNKWRHIGVVIAGKLSLHVKTIGEILRYIRCWYIFYRNSRTGDWALYYISRTRSDVFDGLGISISLCPSTQS